MGFPILDAIGQVSNVVGGVMDRLWPTDGDKQKVETAKTQMKIAVQEALLKENSQFRSFMLDYEGKAKDLPVVIQILRASVRPLLTYLIIGTIAWLTWNGRPIPTQLHQLGLLCAGFWFGERAVNNFIKTT